MFSIGGPATLVNEFFILQAEGTMCMFFRPPFVPDCISTASHTAKHFCIDSGSPVLGYLRFAIFRQRFLMRRAMYGNSATVRHGFMNIDYILDYTPFLLLLTARSLGGHVSAKARLLIVLSCLVSLWGLRYATWIPTQWLFDVEAVWSQQL